VEYRSAKLTRGALLQAPEIQTMYTLNMPVSTIRTKMRQEFERHRYVSKLKTVDVLIYNSHAEFQVRARWWLLVYMDRKNDSLTYNASTGNPQLLEAAHTRPQVLPRGRGPQGDTTEDLHCWFPPGTLDNSMSRSTAGCLLVCLCSIRHANGCSPSCRAVTKSRTLCT
jgi:lysozyme family protein